MQRPKHFLILGGYGNAGIRIARMLLRATDVRITIAGRNAGKARAAASKFNAQFDSERVAAAQIDACDAASLLSHLKNVDLVIVASSTIDVADTVAAQALKAGVDDLDTQLSSPTKLASLRNLQSDILHAGLCFITDAGFHPGVPAAMVRFVQAEFDLLEQANIYASFQIDWQNLDLASETVLEFATELWQYNPTVFKNARWEKLPWYAMPKYNFKPPFGKRTCTPMFMQELYALPQEIPSLRETGFYIAGFNPFVDYVILPALFAGFAVLGERFLPRAASLLHWGLQRFSHPPYLATLELDASGLKSGHNYWERLRLEHEDAYVLTAAPVVACLMQYLQGGFKPGLWLQANLVEPAQFFRDIQALGPNLTIQRARLRSTGAAKPAKMKAA